MSKFQIIFTGIFVVFIVIGVVVFATFKSRNDSDALPSITVWGSYPASTFNQFISKVNTTRGEPINIEYIEIPETGFDRTFIEALARGQGPDAILIPQDLLYRHEDKIIAIPYSIVTERDFRNTFVPQAELYLHPADGVLALPFAVDPLVIYWNRDIFTNAGIATFPRFWDEFSQLGQRINLKDQNSNIRRSLVAMGEFSNVMHAREILSVLFLQSGNPITYRDDSLTLSSALGGGSRSTLDSSVSALNFFTRFSDPRNADYSWNRSLPNSKNSFLAGNLATYIGFASELFDIRQKNQNLNFDAAALPQAPGGSNRVTYAKMYGFSIVRSTQNTEGTFRVLSELLQPASLNELVNLAYLPPVRRDMIASGSIDPYLAIFYDSALIARGWLDSNTMESTRIFREMVENVTSGRQSTMSAVDIANDELDMSLQNP